MPMTTSLFSRRRTLLLVAAATTISVAVPASAQTATDTLAVGAVVADNCTVTTTPIAFGDVDVLTGTVALGTGGMAVTCTNGTAWSASSDAGTALNATPGARQMTAGDNVLNYALYTDTARTTLWGDGTAATVAIPGTGSGTVQDQIIYASVLPGQQTVPVGTYADTINVTITY